MGREPPEDVGVFRQLDRRRWPAILFLQLCGAGILHMPVGDGGGADGDLGRQGRFAGLQHLPRRFNLDKLDRRRRRQGDWSADKRHACAAACQLGGDGMALLAG